MVDKETLRRKKEAEYRSRLENLPGIEFIEFVESPPIYLQALKRKIPVTLLDTLDLRVVKDEKRSEWVKKILRQENIFGEYLFAFSGVPFARVKIDASPDWVDLFWKRKPSYTLIFVSLFEDYALMFEWTENCKETDCFIAEVAHLTDFE